MQFALIIFINIILWAVFYLVISLKLERSASEFRSKRLRREMDDIMQEFNATAERNISILENRIAAAKKILAETGQLKQVNFNIEDDVISRDRTASINRFDASIEKAKSLHTQSVDEAANPGMYAGDHGNTTGTIRKNHETITLENFIGACANSLDLRFKKLKQFFINKPVKKANHVSVEFNVNKKVDNTIVAGSDVEVRKDVLPGESLNIIQKDFKSLHAIAAKQPEKKEPNKLGESELIKLFESSEDRYSLISDLHCKGYPVELLSQCSGIPMGEIKLVLNLHM